jgi:uncharacterized protein YceH (UPF0502 family)
LASYEPDADRDKIARETRFQIQRFAGVALLKSEHLADAIRNHTEHNQQAPMPRDMGKRPKTYAPEFGLVKRAAPPPAAPAPVVKAVPQSSPPTELERRVAALQRQVAETGEAIKANGAVLKALGLAPPAVAKSEAPARHLWPRDLGRR